MVNPPGSARPFRSHVRRVFERAEFIVEHTALLGVFLVCIKALEWLNNFLWRSGDLLLLDRFPVRYIFQAVDLAVLLVFAVGTVWTAIIVFVLRK
jgi:hypothetical protein